MLGTFGPGFVPISGCTAPDGSLRCNPITDASCDHSMDLGVMCRKCDDLRSRVEDQCPIQVTSESIDEARTTSNLLIQNLSQIDGTCITGATTIIIVLGAVTGVLVILLLGTVTALVAICIAFKKR